MAFSMRRGFTLIEILIVIVIIAQLAAILFPVFSRARDSARRISCAGNLKQIGLGIVMYASDNDDYYPHKPVHPDVDCAWADRILPYTKITTVFDCPSSQKLTYVPGCPATSTTEMNEFKDYLQYDGSYDLNILVNTTQVFPFEATFTHPSDTISVLDGWGRSIAWIGKDMTTWDGATSAGVKPPRHFVGYNVLFLDGHVKWMKQEKLLVPFLWDSTAQAGFN